MELFFIKTVSPCCQYHCTKEVRTLARDIYPGYLLTCWGIIGYSVRKSLSLTVVFTGSCRIGKSLKRIWQAVSLYAEEQSRFGALYRNAS